MKKIRKIMVVVCMVAMATVAYGQVHTLHDIDGHWAEATIRKLVDNEVISGYPDGSFKPQKNVRVDEYIKLCISSLPGFSYDKTVAYTYWATPYIQYALENKIITSEEFPNFQKAITREEMALVSLKTLSQLEMIMSVDDTGLELEIKDYYLISDYMKDAVLRSYGMGLLTGRPGDLFDPKGYATRAEAAVVIDRLKDTTARKPYDFDMPFFTHVYEEFTQDGYVKRNLKVLAPKDKKGAIKTDIVDLYNYGQTMKDKYRKDATFYEDYYSITTPDYSFSSSYYNMDRTYTASFWRKEEGSTLSFPYDLDFHIELRNFMFHMLENPYTFSFYGFNDWAYYEEKYGHILDGYMAYIFGEDKDYVIDLIDKDMKVLQGPNDYSVENRLNKTYTLKNGRTVNMRSTGNSSYIIYVSDRD